MLQKVLYDPLDADARNNESHRDDSGAIPVVDGIRQDGREDNEQADEFDVSATGHEILLDHVIYHKM